MMLRLLLLLLLFLAACQGQKDDPIVTTNSLGKIRGHYKKSFAQKTFSAFEGIPFAKPPIGENRFLEPQPIGQLSGTWDATHLHTCAQIQVISEQIQISGDEDCLYLNVYVPRDHPSPSEKLDVIIHIHGGGFMFGNGHFYAHPEYLMDHDVIFVTFNYRLGVFGFLSTADEVVPGNNGLKDQVLAMKWIKENIASFGGNPESVTLTGASAGGASVHLHYFSPMSRGLFHRGLSQSGSALNPWAMKRPSLDRVKMLASAVGCPDDSSSVILQCLKQRNYRQILEKIAIFYEYKKWPIVVFGPVVEKKKSGAFLSQAPTDLLAAKEIQDLPWTVSIVPHEAGSMLPNFENDTDTLNTLWEEIAPFILGYSFSSVPKDNWKEVAQKLRNFYLGDNQKFTNENYASYVKIGTDYLIVNGVIRSAHLQAQVSNSSVYLYQFSYPGDYKRTVEHADDNQYFFYDKMGRQPSQNELNMKEIMVNMLVSYAKTGQPNIEEVDWESVQPNQINFLNISGFEPKDIKLQTGGNLGNNHFWDSLP